MDATAPARIRLDRITKQYPDGTTAVAELSLEIPPGELVCLVGPSGCGKSTTMRMINRLVEPTSGTIWLDDEDVTKTDVVRLRRRLGYVIQQVGLFPHQDIRTNVGTVPKLLGWDAKRIRTRSDELLDLVGLDPSVFGKRYPHELSGGQRQRVGVARALAVDPAVLLMDEPFSAIDPIARGKLQDEFLRLQADVRKTIVMVTHDIDEAVKMADRVAVLSDGGKLEQYGSPAELLAAPASSFVADFVGRDRALRRLAVTPITPEALVPMSELPDGLRTDDAPKVAMGSSLKDAASLLLGSDSSAVVVTDKVGSDQVIGALTLDAIHRGLRAAAPEPSDSETASETAPA